MTLLHAADKWLFGPGSSHRLASVRTGLAIALAVRIALGPFRHLPPQPGGLFQPPSFLSWLDGMPSGHWILALQMIGLVAALAAVAGRHIRPMLLVAWTCLLVLAGLKGSYGKVLHNDLLLIWACIPILLAPSDARVKDRTLSLRYGWPVQCSLAIVSMVYMTAGVQKLAHSGIAWVASDNMRWILYEAASSSRVRWPDVALAIADRPWLAHLVAGALLAGELLAPFLILPVDTRRMFIAYAVALHIGTWLVVGLDYWAWLLTVTVVVMPRGDLLRLPANPQAAASPGDGDR